MDDQDGPEDGTGDERERERRLRDARERDLLQRLGAGQLDMQSGSSLLLRTFRVYILKFFKFQGLSVADAEDQTQVVLVRAWEKAASYRGEASARTWLNGIARHALIDFWRERNRVRRQNEDVEAIPEMADESPSVGAVLDRQSWEDCYRRELARFAHDHPERAEAIRRQVLDQLSTAEVGELLGRSPGATREFLSQSRAKLQGYLSRCREFREALHHA